MAKRAQNARELRAIERGMETPEARSEALARFPRVPGRSDTRTMRIDQRAKQAKGWAKVASFGTGQWWDMPLGHDARQRVKYPIAWIPMGKVMSGGQVGEIGIAHPGSVPAQGPTKETRGLVSPIGAPAKPRVDTRGFKASIWRQVRDLPLTEGEAYRIFGIKGPDSA